MRKAASAMERPMRTEREKMLAGELYDPLDPELVAGRDAGARPLPGPQRHPRGGAGGAAAHPDASCSAPGANASGCSRRSSATTARTSCWASGCSSTSTASCWTSARCASADFTLFGPAVQIYTATHPMNAELRRRAGVRQADRDRLRRVGRRRGDHLPGVRIGSRAVIGAGSVVTRDIPEGVFAAGNPCRVIREITE